MYNLIIKQKFTLIKHPNIDSRWPNFMKVRFNGKNTYKINTKNTVKGLSVLESLPIPYLLKKPTQELILAAIRAEEHLIKLPTHPNKKIYRACVHCQNETNNALHIFTECPVAYYIWKLYEAVIYITTTKRITVKPELILMMKLPPKLDTLP